MHTDSWSSLPCTVTRSTAAFYPNSGTSQKGAVPSLHPSDETQMGSTILGFICIRFPTKWVSRICSSYMTYPLYWSNKFFFPFPPAQTPPLCFLLLCFWMFMISHVVESCWIGMGLGEVMQSKWAHHRKTKRLVPGDYFVMEDPGEDWVNRLGKRLWGWLWLSELDWRIWRASPIAHTAGGELRSSNR